MVETLSPRWIFTRFAVIYLVTYALLILVWEPYNLEFWIALVPVLAILIACRLGSEKGVIPASLVLVVALFSANLVGAIWPYSRAESDYWYMENAGFAALAHNGDVIVTECGYVCDGDLTYRTGARDRTIEASSDDVDVLASALASPAKGRVFVSSWAFDPPESAGETMGKCSDVNGGNCTGEVLTMLEGMRGRLVEVGRSGSQVIWQVAPHG